MLILEGPLNVLDLKRSSLKKVRTSRKPYMNAVTMEKRLPRSHNNVH